MIQMNEIKGSKRALWTSVGAGAGIVSGWLLAEGVYHVSGEGQGIWREPAGAGLILGLAGGGAALGYFTGRSSDRVETYIKVIPEQSPPETTAVIGPERHGNVVAATQTDNEDHTLAQTSQPNPANEAAKRSFRFVDRAALHPSCNLIQLSTFSGVSWSRQYYEVDHLRLRVDSTAGRARRVPISSAVRARLKRANSSIRPM